MTRAPIAALALMAMALAGCAVQKTDYAAYLEHMPQSVLVLPPVNHTANAEATDAFSATVTQPLAERGYYVFPVVVVDRLMKENGLPTAGDMRQAPIEKLREVFGADAVLYIDILDWQTQYLVIDSSTIVTLHYQLVDLRTGTALWNWEQKVTHSSSQGQSNIIGMAIAAAIHQLTTGLAQREVSLAAQANTMAVNDPNCGMLIGARHPQFQADQEQRKAELAAQLQSAQAKQGGS